MNDQNSKTTAAVEMGLLTRGPKKRAQTRCNSHSEILICFCFGVVIFFFVGLCTFFWLNFVASRNSPAQVPVADPKEHDDVRPLACVACAYLQADPAIEMADDEILQRLSRSNFPGDPNSRCCAYNSDQMSALLEATLRRQEPPEEPLNKYNATNFQFSPASAHMRFYPPKGFVKNQAPTFSRKGPIRVTFKKPNSIHFNDHARGIDVEKEGFRIRYSGLYMVYSNIEYRPNHGGYCSELQYNKLSHYVYVQSPGRPEKKILETSYTCCKTCFHIENTRFTSGVFILHEGDFISSKVMGWGLHFYGKDTSYMGAVMLGTSTG